MFFSFFLFSSPSRDLTTWHNSFFKWISNAESGFFSLRVIYTSCWNYALEIHLKRVWSSSTVSCCMWFHVFLSFFAMTLHHFVVLLLTSSLQSLSLFYCSMLSSVCIWSICSIECGTEEESAQNIRVEISGESPLLPPCTFIYIITSLCCEPHTLLSWMRLTSRYHYVPSAEMMVSRMNS